MGQDFRMTIGSDPAEVGRVAGGFAGFAEANGLPEAVRRNVLVALDDLVANPFMHGKAREVTIEARVSGDRLQIVISDDGEPFDLLAAAPPDTRATAEMRAIGGLGIHLARKLMDEVRYEHRDGRNIVSLTKRMTDGR